MAAANGAQRTTAVARSHQDVLFGIIEAGRYSAATMPSSQKTGHRYPSLNSRPPIGHCPQLPIIPLTLFRALPNCPADRYSIILSADPMGLLRIWSRIEGSDRRSGWNSRKAYSP